MAERAVTAARRLVAKKQRMNATAAEAKIAKEDYDREERAFWEMMADESRETDTLDLGPPYGRVQFIRNETVRGTVINKPVALQAIREANLEEALIETEGSIRQGALNDYMRRWTKPDTEDDIPAGLDFTSKKFITVTPKKNQEADDD